MKRIIQPQEHVNKLFPFVYATIRLPLISSTECIHKSFSFQSVFTGVCREMSSNRSVVSYRSWPSFPLFPVCELAFLRPSWFSPLLLAHLHIRIPRPRICSKTHRPTQYLRQPTWIFWRQSLLPTPCPLNDRMSDNAFDFRSTRRFCCHTRHDQIGQSG